MKPVFLVLLGAILTLGSQAIMTHDFPLIQPAEAAGKPCVIIYESNPNNIEDKVNSHYRNGYRMKAGGIGSSGIGSGNSLFLSAVFVMCR